MRQKRLVQQSFPKQGIDVYDNITIFLVAALYCLLMIRLHRNRSRASQMGSSTGTLLADAFDGLKSRFLLRSVHGLGFAKLNLCGRTRCTAPIHRLNLLIDHRRESFRCLLSCLLAFLVASRFLKIGDVIKPHN